MLNVTFLGTGEAFDPDRCTTSYLIEHKGDKSDCSIMIDCGYDAPKSLMRLLDKQGRSLADVPNALLFTHEHGDHFGGLPALLMPIWEEVNGIVGNRKDGIKRKLEVMSAHPHLSTPERIMKHMEEDYKGFFERFKREGPTLSYRTLNPDGDFIYELRVSAAQTTHGAPNYAYRLGDGEREIAISGDGALTDKSRELFRGVDLLVHEGFYVDQSSKNHASIKEVVDYAIEAKLPRVAIVHVNREERRKIGEIDNLIEYARKNGVHVFLPFEHYVA